MPLLHLQRLQLSGQGAARHAYLEMIFTPRHTFLSTGQNSKFSPLGSKAGVLPPEPLTTWKLFKVNHFPSVQDLCC